MRFRIPKVKPSSKRSHVSQDWLSDVFSCSSSNASRTKPSYCSCWVLPDPDGFTPMSTYGIDGADVVIGEIGSGETEYHLRPWEYAYSREFNRIIGCISKDVIDMVSSGNDIGIDSAIQQKLLENYNDIISSSGTDDVNMGLDSIRKTVKRNVTGSGVFELLLSDPHLEDIYVDAPCSSNRVHVTMNGVDGMNNHLRCRTNLILEDSELDALINIVRRESGLRFCHTNPVIETDMPGFDARVTVMGYPMSPNGNALALRKRSREPWTLSRLILNGTIDSDTAGILSFLVNARTSILIAGARGTGKSSIMGALMLEFDVDTRVLTIEDTIELPGDTMRSLGYKVQSILVDDKMQGDQLSRSDEALRVSLRMGESAIILGEVRGEEARTLYRSMNTGKSGSSVMGTIHGDSAESVFNRVVNDMGVSEEAFGSTDVVMVLKMVRDRQSGQMRRRVCELKSTTDQPGVFMDIMDRDRLYGSKVFARAMEMFQYDDESLMKDIRIRSELHRALSEAGALDPSYLGPRWIMEANMAVDVDSDETRLISRFRSKVGLGCH